MRIVGPRFPPTVFQIGVLFHVQQVRRFIYRASKHLLAYMWANIGPGSYRDNGNNMEATLLGFRVWAQRPNNGQSNQTPGCM